MFEKMCASSGRLKNGYLESSVFYEGIWIEIQGSSYLHPKGRAFQRKNRSNPVFLQIQFVYGYNKNEGKSGCLTRRHTFRITQTKLSTGARFSVRNMPVSSDTSAKPKRLPSQRR